MPGPRRVTRRDFFKAPAVAAPPAADFWLRINRRIMACRFEVVLPGEDSGSTAAAREALDLADRLEEVMTIFRDASELSHVNRSAAGAPVAVSPDLFAVLEMADRISRETGGAFDITSTPLSRCWGFLRREGRLPAPREIDDAKKCVGMDRVRLDKHCSSVSFDAAGVTLNLGAIGKGFALDRMSELLRARGVRRALLSAGSSSILATGGATEPWPVDLRSSVTQARLARLHIARGAVGTSGAGEQYVEVDGVRYGHVIDPRSGWPASGTLSATVVTGSAAAADALSTAFFIGGCELAERYCAGHPGVLALITPDDGSGRPLPFGSYDGIEVESA